jgi:hypothetical protein
MGGPKPLSRDDWEAILHAPFHVYSAVASADGVPSESEFRSLRDGIEASRAAFGGIGVGHEMIETLAGNLDVLWAGYQASGRSAKDGVKRAVKALRRVQEAESAAIRDWLLLLGIQVAEARKIIGEEPVNPGEQQVIAEVAAWLERPLPTADPT